MHLRFAMIENLRSIEKFSVMWADDECAGWHVFLGDNGSGKTTFARALALGFVGPDESDALRVDWNDWLPAGAEAGQVVLYVTPHWTSDRPDGRARKINGSVAAGVLLTRASADRVDAQPAKFKDRRTFPQHDPRHYFWGNGAGWFSAAYGPFRRFSGGDKSFEKLFHIKPRLGRHLSVFGEEVALTEATEWLRQLDIERLRHPKRHALLDDVKAFVNQAEFLPHHAKFLDVQDDVVFVDGNKCRVPVTQLSDGYRSVLSMTFELLRQLVASYGADAVFELVRKGEKVIPVPGVVIIDEVDAHLHPPWQQRIGFWLTKVFPAIQFIVTTHSPLVCQAAEKGSVWRLPTPGTKEQGRRVTGTELNRLVKGDLLEAMDTGLFGKDVGRSKSAEHDLEELARLNRLALKGKLTAAQQKRRAELQAQLPTRANDAAE